MDRDDVAFPDPNELRWFLLISAPGAGVASVGRDVVFNAHLVL
jgi:hypothetical protein